MHIVHGPKGGTSVPKAVGHCVRMRARACRMRGTSLGAKTTGKWTGFLFSFVLFCLCTYVSFFFFFFFFLCISIFFFFFFFFFFFGEGVWGWDEKCIWRPHPKYLL